MKFPTSQGSKLNSAEERLMAEILEFKFTNRTSNARKDAGSKSADVIVFPGTDVKQEKFSLADRLKPGVLKRAPARRGQPKTRD